MKPKCEPQPRGKAMKKTKTTTKPKTAGTVQPETPQPLATTEKDQAAKSATKRDEQLRELLKDRPIYVNSIASGMIGLDHGSVLGEMQNARAVMLRFYLSE